MLPSHSRVFLSLSFANVQLNSFLTPDSSYYVKPKVMKKQINA
ncbi:hypothetical protein D051_1488 [Vibrio parahaemolyticus VPCR-2010]|nr:hypothetical protein D051_1488 [Vibrio parahaemolyticus VPCR-2010]